MHPMHAYYHYTILRKFYFNLRLPAGRYYRYICPAARERRGYAPLVIFTIQQKIKFSNKKGSLFKAPLAF